MNRLPSVLALVWLTCSTAQQVRSQTSALGGSVKNVSVGAFTVAVPVEWSAFRTAEASTLRQQYIAQSKQICQQFSGGCDPSKPIGLAAFHIAGDDGAFIVVSFAVPPQSDLIALLKGQVKAKMDFGIQQGFIRKYLGLVSVDDDAFSGFYTKAIGKSGNVEVSGGLEHKRFKNTVIQLTLLSPQTWDQSKAADVLGGLLNSLALVAK